MANHGSVRSPRQGYVPPPLAMRKNTSGLLIISVVGFVILLGLGILAFSLTDGDDSPPLTLVPQGATTTLFDDSVTTLPASSDIIAVRDDTDTFSVNIPGNLQRETAPSIAAGGFTVPRITASDDLPSYYADNTTFGVLVVAVGPDIGSEVAQVLAFMEPNETLCKERVKETIATSLGSAVRISLTGCGVDNLGTKVMLSIQIAEPPLVIGIRMQDTGDLTSIQSAALYLLDTMQFGEGLQ